VSAVVAGVGRGGHHYPPWARHCRWQNAPVTPITPGAAMTLYLGIDQPARQTTICLESKAQGARRARRDGARHLSGPTLARSGHIDRGSFFLVPLSPGEAERLVAGQGGENYVLAVTPKQREQPGCLVDRAEAHGRDTASLPVEPGAPGPL